MSETIEQKCISKGVKLTDQRRVIAQVMSRSSDHPDVDELYNRVSQIDPKIKRQHQVLFGGGLFLLGILLAISFVSYTINWKEDYSTLGYFFDESVPAKNILSKVGAFVSHLFIYNGVGFASIIFSYLLCLIIRNIK